MSEPVEVNRTFNFHSHAKFMLFLYKGINDWFAAQKSDDFWPKTLSRLNDSDAGDGAISIELDCTSRPGLLVKYSLGDTVESRVIIGLQGDTIRVECRYVNGTTRIEELHTFGFEPAKLREAVRRAIAEMRRFFKSPNYLEPQ